tara:strand:- start:222 stop:455 length:234 start_codon:yes stop_codon:yes gene_type:complete
MDEQDQIKAKQYDSLMSQYVHYENELKSVPTLSLEEQMKHIDITTKKLYTEKNQIIVNNIVLKLRDIEAQAKRIQLG